MLEIKGSDITITQYNTADITVTPFYVGSEEVYTLSEGEKVVFTVRSQVTGEVMLEKTLTTNDYNADGDLVLTLTSADTAIGCEQYAYDVALITQAGDFYTFIPKSTFRVVTAITKGDRL